MSLFFLVAALGTPHGHGQAPKRPTLVSPEVQADGKVTFRLAAPKADKVVLNSGEMQPVLKTVVDRR